MNNELSEYMRETVKHILELKMKVEFLEEEIMRHALHIHNLQEHTGTQPHKHYKEKDE